MDLALSLSIIFFAIVVPLLLLIGAKKIGQSVWTVLAACGTIAAVVWAIYSQGFLSWFNRPVLKIIPYLEIHPHLIEVPIMVKGRKITKHALILNLKNEGKTIANRARPFVTAIASSNDKDEWSLQNNWVPTPLKWSLEYYDTRVTGIPSKDKNLVPERPYLFELGYFSKTNSDSFQLSWSRILRHQSDKFKKGKHCFEITAYAEEAEAKKIYVKLDWNGEYPLDNENIEILVSDSKPKFWPSK